MSTLNDETPPRLDDARPLLAPALLMFLLGTFGPVFVNPGGTTGMIGALIVCQVASIVAAIMFASRHKSGFALIGLERAGLRRSIRVTLIGFILIGSSTYLTNIVTQIVLKHFDALPNQNHPMLEIMQNGSTIELALAIISAVFVAPVFEEVLFRGHFQPLFSQLFGVVGSLLATSVLFTILHPWWTMPAIFLLSVMLCVVRWKTSGIWAPLGIHVLFNLTSTILFLIWG